MAAAATSSSVRSTREEPTVAGCTLSTRSQIGGATTRLAKALSSGSNWIGLGNLDLVTSTGSDVPAGSEDFRISVRDDDDVVIVTIEGEVDVATAPALRDELYRLIERGTKRIIVDLGGMEFIDSTGLGVFVGALKRSREGGDELQLRSLRPAARKIFDITGLSTAFSID
jgi:anti-sigma B factor antagonist